MLRAGCIEPEAPQTYGRPLVLYVKETAVQANSWMTKISVKEDARMRHGWIQAILYCGWFLLRPAVTGDSNGLTKRPLTVRKNAKTTKEKH